VQRGRPVLLTALAAMFGFIPLTSSPYSIPFKITPPKETLSTVQPAHASKFVLVKEH